MEKYCGKFAQTVGRGCRLGERVFFAGVFVDDRLGIFLLDVRDDCVDVVLVEHDSVIT